MVVAARLDRAALAGAELQALFSQLVAVRSDGSSTADEVSGSGLASRLHGLTPRAAAPLTHRVGSNIAIVLGHSGTEIGAQGVPGSQVW